LPHKSPDFCNSIDGDLSKWSVKLLVFVGDVARGEDEGSQKLEDALSRSG